MKIEQLFKKNPFDILELKNNASIKDIEHSAHKIIGMLRLKIKGANEYQTVLGIEKRDETDVREAASLLKDPVKRIFYDFWHDDLISEPKKQRQASKKKIDFMTCVGFRRGQKIP